MSKKEKVSTEEEVILDGVDDIFMKCRFRDARNTSRDGPLSGGGSLYCTTFIRHSIILCVKHKHPCVPTAKLLRKAVTASQECPFTDARVRFKGVFRHILILKLLQSVLSSHAHCAIGVPRIQQVTRPRCWSVRSKLCAFCWARVLKSHSADIAPAFVVGR